MTPMLAAQRLAQRLAERLAQRLAESDAITQSIRHFYRNGSATHRTVPELVSSETRNGLNGYNNLNQRTSRLDEGAAFSAAAFDAYGYNGTGELTASNRYAGADTGNTSSPITARDRAYAYDGIGNRTSFTQAGGTPLTYTSNKLNQYTATSDSNDSFSYDDDGNMTLVYQASAGKLMNYFYDGENRLTEVRPVVPASGDKKVESSYDYRSRRVGKKVSTFNGSAWNVDTDERFLYDGWNVVAVYDAVHSFDLLKTSTWGLDVSGSTQGAGGVGGLLGCEEMTGTHAGDYVFAFDGNGNAGQVIDGSGSIAAAYEYDAFGRTAASSGSYKDANVYRFSTKHVDVESDLYYYGYRFYSAGLGRWTQRDPIGEQGGRNLYGMVGNDSVSQIDFLGLKKFHAGAGQCKRQDSCSLNEQRLREWLKEAADRWPEIMDPAWIAKAVANIPFKPGEYFNPNVKTPRQAWNNHIAEWNKAMVHGINCAHILIQQILAGECICSDPKAMEAWVNQVLQEFQRQAQKLPSLDKRPLPVSPSNDLPAPSVPEPMPAPVPSPVPSPIVVSYTYNQLTFFGIGVPGVPAPSNLEDIKFGGTVFFGVTGASALGVAAIASAGGAGLALAPAAAL